MLAAFFQNNEFLIPFTHITHVEKHPPDRLTVHFSGGSTVDLLNSDTCTAFVQAFGAWLNR